MTDYDIIRKFETEVLDQHHTTLPFFEYSDDIIIPYLLQCYGDIDRFTESALDDGSTRESLERFRHLLMHGISYCIQWAKSKKHSKYNDIKNDQLALELCTDFFNWGISYYQIAQDFTLWSRGIMAAVLDMQTKTISFIPPEGYNYYLESVQQKLYKRQLLYLYDSYPLEELQNEFAIWAKDTDLLKHTIKTIDWSRARYSTVYQTFLIKIIEVIFPELPEYTDLGGYTVLQLRQFYSLFYINFQFIRWVESVRDTHNGKQLFLGSRPMYLSKTEFITLASVITGLSSGIVWAIIVDLTFNGTGSRTTISIQPFVQSNSGTYYILPNLFCISDPSRMIAGAFNKGAKKKVYDKLINKIEKNRLQYLYNSIKDKTGWECFCEKNLKHFGKQFKPDFIIIDHSCKTVLVADYKHFIAPITTSEVECRMKEIIKGMDKIKAYIEVISMLHIVSSVPIFGYQVSGIIITHKPLPVPVQIGDSIPLVDSISFVEWLTKNGHGHLNLLIEQLHSIIEKHIKKDIIPSTRNINVNDWTITRALYIESTEQKL